jgi:hypothetical protein
MNQTRKLYVLSAGLAILGLVVACAAPSPTIATPNPRAGATAPASTYTFAQLSDPDRIEARQDGIWVATFTLGAYTVALAGPSRTFTEPGAAGISITHATWVRTLPAPFQAPVNETWLAAARNANANNVPDILQLGMQYVKDALPITEGELQIAGDACYGPAEGADFHDYLGIHWDYPPPEGGDTPKSFEFRCLDCSGFMRMIFGYRHSMAGAGYADQIPLLIAARPERSAIPRRSNAQCDAGPGVIVIPNTGKPIADFSKLQIGDLLCWDASGDDGMIDHVGMYMGIDNSGKHRFISSRKSIDGPTLGDYNGASILDGTGLYARSFRMARRY